MSIFPTTREGRWRFVLSALGAYIFGVPLVGILSELVAERAGWSDLGKSYGALNVLRAEEAHRYFILECGYVACIVALLLILPALHDKRARRFALQLVALGVVFLLLFVYPMTQFEKTRSMNWPNHRAALDAGRAACLHSWRDWPGASDRGC